MTQQVTFCPRHAGHWMPERISLRSHICQALQKPGKISKYLLIDRAAENSREERDSATNKMEPFAPTCKDVPEISRSVSEDCRMMTGICGTKMTNSSKATKPL